MNRSLTWVLVASAVLCGWSVDGRAMSFQVKPVRITLDQARRTESIEILNKSEGPINLQVSAVEWTQDEGARDAERPTREVIFHPKLFTLAAGKTQIIRLGLKHPVPGQVERTYRLYIRELPQPDLERRQGSGLKILLRAGVPIFHVPFEAKASGRITDLQLAQCQVRFSMKNTGNVHLAPGEAEVRVLDGQGVQLQKSPVKMWYVLAGERWSATLDLEPGVCSMAQKVVVHLESGKLRLDAETLARGGISPVP